MSLYHARSGVLTLFERQPQTFEGSLPSGALADLTCESFDRVSSFAEFVDHKSIRVYATGVFQRLSQADAASLVNSFYVDTGLYFNIVGPELEQFYAEAGRSTDGSTRILEGVIRREFRKVAVCGSFQNSLRYIEDVIARLREKGAAVLSPLTTKIKPETEGTDFILFDYQDLLKNERDTWRHKYHHMAQFGQSDAIIVCNPGGIVGKGTMFELGFVSALGKRVIFTEEPVGLSVFFPYEVGLEA
ncbi:nucleoside 2-deoxyribosyltransferase [Saccharothrix luteola]|uniref:nucleoside 2-deoxyribosyltransferase n=1 Tax=Saccharothrix luteola TaxID=2893018 RepID=UPI001E5D8158|nr:nucleoside 2-deoxyribosyltransferase [Saccharothrix luteola]MCC8250532.1 nucleoside 2-deoxyribosyltransferase [Saccharothrix luteola]